LTYATCRITVQDDPVDSAQGIEAHVSRGRPERRKPQHVAKPTQYFGAAFGCPYRCGLGFTGLPAAWAKGEMKGFWAVTVRANWRVIFRVEDGYAEDVDYVDYH
jgi:hypothetical protein